MKPPRVWGQMLQEGRFPFKHTLGSGARANELQANEREEFPGVSQEEPGFPGEAAETQVNVELRPTLTLTASLGWIPRRPQPPLQSPNSNRLRVTRFATSCIHPHPPVPILLFSFNVLKEVAIVAKVSETVSSRELVVVCIERKFERE